MKELMANEELIDQLRTDHPEADKQQEAQSLANFQLSKHTKSACVDFLKDNDVEIDTWIEDVDSSEKVK
jgi:hypothetical protein